MSVKRWQKGRFKNLKELNGYLNRHYRGKWFARAGTKVLAISDDLSEVIQEAKQKTQNTIHIKHISKEDPEITFYQFAQ